MNPPPLREDRADGTLTLTLDRPELSIAVDEVYRGIEFDPE